MTMMWPLAVEGKGLDIAARLAALTGFVQAAAREVSISASAIDRQIMMLEEDLGVPLFERLPRGMRLTAAGELLLALSQRWKADLAAAYDDFVARVDRGLETAIDPYAAESPGEFFAVLSEVFFAAPGDLFDAYPDVYRQFVGFYRQDPLARLDAAVRGVR